MGCWSYVLGHESDLVEMANVRWLSRYRHLRNRIGDVAQELAQEPPDLVGRHGLIAERADLRLGAVDGLLACGELVPGPPTGPDPVPPGGQLAAQQPQRGLGQMQPGRVDKHSEAPGRKIALGRQPVYLELRRSVTSTALSHHEVGKNSLADAAVLSGDGIV